jgi:probable phosphoglycerate mutase
MNNRYFLMRHGESEANVANRIVGDPGVGCLAFGLTPRGKQQALDSALRSGLSSETMIFCSDFLRARQTAEIVGQALGCSSPVLEPRLRERFFGTLEGTSADNYARVWSQDDVDPDGSPWGAEPASLVAQRSGQLWLELESLHSGKCILLVSHGDTLRFLQLWAAGRPLTEHQRVRHFSQAEIRALDDIPPAAAGPDGPASRA